MKSLQQSRETQKIIETRNESWKCDIMVNLSHTNTRRSGKWKATHRRHHLHHVSARGSFFVLKSLVLPLFSSVCVILLVYYSFLFHRKFETTPKEMKSHLFAMEWNRKKKEEATHKKWPASSLCETNEPGLKASCLNILRKMFLINFYDFLLCGNFFLLRECRIRGRKSQTG